MKIQLVLSPDCPNIDAARESLRVAAPGESWEEIDVTTPAGSHLAGYGSPTILVDGEDVTGEGPAGAPCCRVAGAPTPDQIQHAMQRARGARRLPVVAGGLSLAAVACPTAVALCPACWPAYLAAVSSLLTPAIGGIVAILPIACLLGALVPLLRRVRAQQAWSAGFAIATGALLVLEARWLASLPLGALGALILTTGAFRIQRRVS